MGQEIAAEELTEDLKMVVEDLELQLKIVIKELNWWLMPVAETEDFSRGMWLELQEQD